MLRMMNETFPVLDRVDFDGDIFRSANGEGGSYDAYDDGDEEEEWRNEVLARIMECLPNIVAVDGFVVELDGVPGGAESRSGEDPGGSNEAESLPRDASVRDSEPHLRQGETSDIVEAEENSSSCVDWEGPMCGLSDLVVDAHTQNSLSSTTTMDESMRCEKRGLYDSMPNDDGEGDGDEMGEHDLATLSLNEIENVSDNDLSGGGVQNNVHELPPAATVDSPSNEHYSKEDTKKIPGLSSSSSLLSSSRSWGSNGSSGARPPTCPNTTPRQHRPRLPAKPIDRKKKGSFTNAGGRLKRRVLGLIPSVSMMDDDDEDDSSEDSEENEMENDCPTDLL